MRTLLHFGRDQPRATISFEWAQGNLQQTLRLGTYSKINLFRWTNSLTIYQIINRFSCHSSLKSWWIGPTLNKAMAPNCEIIRKFSTRFFFNSKCIGNRDNRSTKKLTTYFRASLAKHAGSHFMIDLLNIISALFQNLILVFEVLV